MGFEHLKKMGEHITSKQRTPFHENAMPSKNKWKDIKETSKKYGKKFGETQNHLRKSLPGLASGRWEKNIERQFYGKSQANPHYKQQQHKQPGTHIYLHYIEEKNRPKKKKMMRIPSYDDTLNSIFNQYGRV